MATGVLVSQTIVRFEAISLLFKLHTAGIQLKSATQVAHHSFFRSPPGGSMVRYDESLGILLLDDIRNIFISQSRRFEGPTFTVAGI